MGKDKNESTSIKREKISREQALEKEIAFLEKQQESTIANYPFKQNISDRIKVLKETFEKLFHAKPKKLFFAQSLSGILMLKRILILSLEKRHFNQGMITN